MFPLSSTRANVGAGIFRTSLTAHWMPDTSREVFDTFVATPALRKLLQGAHLDGPIKGFPVRVDFAKAPTFANRTIVVGEAAGLVNPVTGEGIDYAMESARIAARHIAAMFRADDFANARLQAYDRELRQAYQRLFLLCDRLRLAYLNPVIVNCAISAAARLPELAQLYMNIALENDNVTQALSAKTLLHVALS